MVAELATVAIRQAERRDVRAIRSIDAKVYPKPWSENMTLQQVIGPDRVHLVVEEDHRVIAHGAVLFAAGDAHITTVAVDPLHQRRGIGAVMLRHLLDAARAARCNAATLEVRVGNAAAIALYERDGFDAAGVRPRYYADTGEDALIMWKDLGVERMRNDSVGVETDA